MFDDPTSHARAKLLAVLQRQALNEDNTKELIEKEYEEKKAR